MINKILDLIKSSTSIALFFHINPDGDAVGSSLALKFALEQMGKKVQIFSQDIIPEKLQFLNCKSISTKISNEKFDLAIVLDCPDIKRIGNMISVYKNCKKSINIDHHLFNQNFTENKLVDSNASSTCEIVYNFINKANLSFTKEICLSLYTGIATDSGCFMYNVSDSLHKIVHFLLKNFDNVEDVNFILFRQKRKEELSLYADSLTKLEYHLNGKLALTYITLKDLERLNATTEDTVGLVYLLSGLKGVDVICVMCEEVSGQYKIAFRSKTTDVCGLAKLFGGGGHKFASGCKIYGTKNIVKSKIVDKTRKYLCTE